MMVVVVVVVFIVIFVFCFSNAEQLQDSNPFFLHMFSLFVFLNFTSWSLKVYKSTQKKKRSNLRNGLLAPILIL